MCHEADYTHRRHSGCVDGDCGSVSDWWSGVDDCLLATSIIFDVTVIIRSDMERIGVCTHTDLWHVETGVWSTSHCRTGRCTSLYVRHSADFASFWATHFHTAPDVLCVFCCHALHCGILLVWQEAVDIRICNLYPAAQAVMITFEDVVSPRMGATENASFKQCRYLSTLIYPGPSFFRSFIFQSLIFFGPPFSGPTNLVPSVYSLRNMASVLLGLCLHTSSLQV